LAHQEELVALRKDIDQLRAQLTALATESPSSDCPGFKPPERRKGSEALSRAIPVPAQSCWIRFWESMKTVPLWAMRMVAIPKASAAGSGSW
jgi:hypothetical protein